MSPTKPKDRAIRTFRVWVPTPTGRVKKGTGTRDRATAKLMETMLHELGPRGTRRWDLLEPVVRGQVSLGQLYDAWRSKTVDRLLATLADTDLRPLLNDWEARLLNAPATAARGREYRRKLSGIVPTDDNAPWLASTLTPEAVRAWLDSLRARNGVVASPATARKHAAALGSFVKFAMQRGALKASPLAGIELEPQPFKPVEFLERDEVERLIAGTPAPYVNLFAFLYGTAAEIGAALAVTRRMVDLERGMVRLPGTKNHNRDRQAMIAEWARPYVAEACRDLLPDAPLFPGIDRWRATKVHGKTLAALGLRHMKLHAARHSWAVRAIRSGWPLEQVRRQMGHADAQMVLRVYGRYMADAEELQRLEARAEAEDQRRRDSVGPRLGTRLAVEG